MKNFSLQAILNDPGAENLNPKKQNNINNSLESFQNLDSMATDEIDMILGGLNDGEEYGSEDIESSYLETISQVSEDHMINHNLAQM